MYNKRKYVKENLFLRTKVFFFFFFLLRVKENQRNTTDISVWCQKSTTNHKIVILGCDSRRSIKTRHLPFAWRKKA